MRYQVTHSSRNRASLLATLVFLVQCGDAAAPIGTTQSESILDCFDMSVKRPEVLYLPAELREISGLAVSSSGSLFAHGDETLAIYEILPLQGQVLRLNNPIYSQPTGDFEGIAVSPERLSLITSTGLIYQGRLPLDGSTFTAIDSRLGGECEIEGFEYRPGFNDYLVLCKNIVDGNKREFRVYSIDPERPEDARIAYSGRLPDNDTSMRRFRGTGLALLDNHILLLSSNERLILDLAADGRILGYVPLDKSVHPQPEGIAVLPDGSLVIANEGKKGPGSIVLYPRRTACNPG